MFPWREISGMKHKFIIAFVSCFNFVYGDKDTPREVASYNDSGFNPGRGHRNLTRPYCECTVHTEVPVEVSA